MASVHEDPAELRKQIERLDEHYRRLVESISEGVATVTLDGVITSLSPACESMSGWPPTRLIGSHIQSLIHPADLPLVIERSQRERNGQRQPPIKLRLLQSSGEYHPVEVSSQPDVEDGTVKGTWVLVRDLTKDEQLERQRDEITQEKRRVQSLMDLIHAVCAWAESPLTVIGLTTHLLSRRVVDPAAISSVETIEYHVRQLTQLVERVLTMAKLDADRTHFSFGPVQLNRLLNYIETSTHTVAEAKKIVVTVKPAEALPPVRADELQLYRAIQEVVGNALEYTPEIGTVTARTFRHESEGVVEVQDTGIGIAPDLMPHLFEPFHQFSLPASAPGKLGLGLPIAKRIVDKHGGTIDVVSTPSNGSTVTIAIPLHTP
jgi:PAS domain S-box-containing protein